MKAKINGIEVEGTPEEVLDFKVKLEKTNSDNLGDLTTPIPFDRIYFKNPDYLMTKITCQD